MTYVDATIHKIVIHYLTQKPSVTKNWLCNQINGNPHANNHILYIAWAESDKLKVNCQECLEYLHS